jgi:hypothetical protein
LPRRLAVAKAALPCGKNSTLRPRQSRQRAG